jgi:hypothetical protein
MAILATSVARIASVWMESGANVRLAFEREAFLPPPGQTSRSVRMPSSAVVSYDVLVSLQPLPVEEPELRGIRRILFPTSMLGSYARRADYGVPTVYLGANPLAKGDEYFSSAMFEYIVVHEFGHVLGLPHEHQNPLRRPAWPSAALIRERLRPVFGVDLPDELIESEVTRPWPAADRDDPSAFSDWRPVADPSSTDFDSIMAYPFCEYLCQTAKAHGALTLHWPRLPTHVDFEQLRRVYPPRAK